LNEDRLATLVMLLPATTITTLSIDWSAESVAWQELCKLVEEDCKLEVLSLRGNHLGELAAAALSEGLQQNTTVKSLDLSQNTIGSNGLAHLSTMLGCNATLQSLSVAGCGITDDGLVPLKSTLGFKILSEEDLEARKALEDEKEAIIAENEVNAGKKGFAPAVVPNLVPLEKDGEGNTLGPANTTLQELILTKNPISAEGANVLQYLLSMNPVLQVAYAKRSDVPAEEEYKYVEPRLFLSEAKATRDAVALAGISAAIEATAMITEATSAEIPPPEEGEEIPADALEVRAVECAWTQCESHLTMEQLQDVCNLKAPGGRTKAVIQAIGALLGMEADDTEEWDTMRQMLVDVETPPEDPGESAEGDAAEAAETASQIPMLLKRLQAITPDSERSEDAEMNFKYYLDTVKWAEKARGAEPDKEHVLVAEHILCHVLYHWMVVLELLRAKRTQMMIDAANNAISQVANEEEECEDQP